MELIKDIIDKQNLERIADYLDKNKSYIINNDYQKIYNDISHRQFWPQMQIRDLTNLLYMSNIDPLVYLDNVPSSFLYFDNSGRKTITLPDNIEYIRSYAFFNCANLEYIKIPEKTTHIYESAFEGCENLNIVFNKGGNLSYIESRAFAHCKSLESINLPASVVNVADEAFAYCMAVKSIVIPRGVNYIDSNAFGDCYDLQTVDWHVKYVECGKDLFRRCSKFSNKPVIINYDYTTADFKRIAKDSLDQFKFDNLVIVKCTDGDLTYGDRVS